ncbi:MAG: ORF6N domain-containing protein [Acidobacteriia bacterium]|nr:ORF6N domain-containing protein [Terriglobia bacterium]
MPKTTKSPVRKLAVPVEPIERRIYLIRDHKVMLDSDLAELYQVPTKTLNLSVRRNRDRFPGDFMFQLSAPEFEILRFQTETSRWGGRRYLPYAFTEQGVAMLSSVLSSKRAVQVNIAIMRVFVRLREYLATHKDLARELVDLKRTTSEHGAHIQEIYTIIEKLIEPPPAPPKRRIGFRSPGKD